MWNLVRVPNLSCNAVIISRLEHVFSPFSLSIFLWHWCLYLLICGQSHFTLRQKNPNHIIYDECIRTCSPTDPLMVGSHLYNPSVFSNWPSYLFWLNVKIHQRTKQKQNEYSLRLFTKIFFFQNLTSRQSSHILSDEKHAENKPSKLEIIVF